MYDSRALLTDLYQLTMAQAYFCAGKREEQACFHAFFRKNPYEGGFSIACGIESIIDLVENFCFDDEDIAYLEQIDAPGGGKLFTREFLDYLHDLKLEVDIDAVQEGEVVFPREPLVRVTGPIAQCQMLETALLNSLNFQLLVATKAARVAIAAQGHPVSEFGLRRAQGPDGGVSASRAACVGGCTSTSNILAGKLYDIPVSGTHAHSWVMSFESELEAFRAYAKAMPKNCVLLVDTYDTIQGIKNAITVGLEMRECGEALSAIRIDSGDLAWFSKQARAMLDEAGLTETKIVASNDLDEYAISSLYSQGAPIDLWGVGTKLATAYDCAALTGVYKLSAIRRSENTPWERCVKVSDQRDKLTIPGVLSVRRYYDEAGAMAGDLIYDTCAGEPDELIVDPMDSLRRKDLSGKRSRELLTPLIRGGKTVRETRSVAQSRAYVQEGLSELDSACKRFLNPHSYPVGMEHTLYDDRAKLVLELRKHVQ